MLQRKTTIQGCYIHLHYYTYTITLFHIYIQMHFLGVNMKGWNWYFQYSIYIDSKTCRPLTTVTDWGFLGAKFWLPLSDISDHPFNVGSSALVWKIRSSYHEHLEASLMFALNKCPHRGKYDVAHLIGNVNMYIHIIIYTNFESAS